MNLPCKCGNPIECDPRVRSYRIRGAHVCSECKKVIAEARREIGVEREYPLTPASATTKNYGMRLI